MSFLSTSRILLPKMALVPKDDFYASHARQLLHDYSVIPRLQVTDQLVYKLVDRMKELQKRMLEYVTMRCGEKWAEVLKSCAIRDHRGTPFADAKRVRSFIKSLGHAGYEPFMLVAIKDHADSYLQPGAKSVPTLPMK
jgi:hypothetical protein